MTTVDFYVNASDKLALAVRLSQKALHQQRQVTMLVGNAQAEALSNMLWAASPTSFLANEIAAEKPLTNTPIVIQSTAGDYQQDDVLINLETAQPAGFSRFKRLIELVSADEVDKAEARKRFKFYKDRGYTIKHIDMLKESA